MSEIFTDEQINEISNNIQKAVNEEINKQIENIMGKKNYVEEVGGNRKWITAYQIFERL